MPRPERIGEGDISPARNHRNCDKIFYGKARYTFSVAGERSRVKAHGVIHAALFGSRARGDNRSDSDIDILVEIAPDFSMDVFAYVGLVHSIEDLFPIRVDVSNRIALRSYVRPTVERDAIYAF